MTMHEQDPSSASRQHAGQPAERNPSPPIDGHPEWTDRFSAYLDDELTAVERQAVEDHVRTCPPCAVVLDELRQVAAAAAALDRTLPGEQVWQAISAQVRAMPRSAPSGRGRRFSFSLPQLVAASVLLALLSGWGALRLVTAPAGDQGLNPDTVDIAPSGRPDEAVDVTHVEVSDPQYDQAVSDLQQALERGRGRLDPDTVTTVEGDLRVIDLALEEARRALLNDPANSYLSGHVFDTRKRKLDLLRRAAALTTDSQM